MLDKSIPYFNILMRRPAGRPLPIPQLPEGYSFALFGEGDEHSWAEIETSVGEFDDVVAALSHFRKKYLRWPEEVRRRTLFVQTDQGEKVATLTCWWEYTGERRDPALHWVGVRPDHQGKGLGKAIVFEGLRRIVRTEGDREVFLHTQTWSYKAIGIYLKAGFELMPTGNFGGHKNDYEQALPIIREKMEEGTLP